MRLGSNNLGLLEDEPTEREKRGLRILVLGDSHMTVVENQESLPNVFEARLRAEGYEGCDVLNSGVGFTSPLLYLRRIEHFLYLDPDVVIVSLYVGNDFWEDVQLEYDFQRSKGPAVGPEYWTGLKEAVEHHSGPLFQGLNQAHWFKHWPGTSELAFSLALSTMDEIQALCRSKGMLLLVVILPTKVAVDLEDEPELRAKAMATLRLSEEDAAINQRLGERLVASLEERGIPCLDPTRAMLEDPRPFFWRQDHHLSVTGHAFVAEAMFAAFEPHLLKWKGSR